MVPGARPWFPHTHGEAKRYTVRAELAVGGGVLDAFEQSVGFRRVRINRSGTPEQLWRARVNGVQVPLRGVNWTGLPLPAGLEYGELVGKLKEAGVNAIRVWGGRHRRLFYEACDREGILVIQEFPYGLLDEETFPRERSDFPAAKEIPLTAKGENKNFVRQLRNHPSLCLWVGGTRLHNQDNAHVMRTVEDALRREDGSRAYVPVFPAEGCETDFEIRTAGQSPEHLEDAPPLLLAQGLPAWPADQAPPEVFPERWRKYGGDAAHARAVAWAAGAQRFEDTAGGFIGEVLDWSPEGGYGLFDFHGRPRKSFEVLRGLYAPTAARLLFDWKAYEKGTFDAEVWGIRDGDNGALAADVWVVDADGNEIAREKVEGEAKGAEVMLGEVALELAGKAPFTAWVEAAGGRPVPYPLDARKPISSESLAEVARLRHRLAIQKPGLRFVRDLYRLGLFPAEGFLRAVFAVRLAIGI